jgi:hypothetical protein
MHELPTMTSISALLWNVQQTANARRNERISAELVLAGQLFDRAAAIRESNADRFAAIQRRMAALETRRRARHVRGAGAAS